MSPSTQMAERNRVSEASRRPKVLRLSSVWWQPRQKLVVVQVPLSGHFAYVLLILVSCFTHLAGKRRYKGQVAQEEEPTPPQEQACTSVLKRNYFCVSTDNARLT